MSAEVKAERDLGDPFAPPAAPVDQLGAALRDVDFHLASVTEGRIDSRSVCLALRATYKALLAVHAALAEQSDLVQDLANQQEARYEIGS